MNIITEKRKNTGWRLVDANEYLITFENLEENFLFHCPSESMFQVMLLLKFYHSYKKLSYCT